MSQEFAGSKAGWDELLDDARDPVGPRRRRSAVLDAQTHLETVLDNVGIGVDLKSVNDRARAAAKRWSLDLPLGLSKAIWLRNAIAHRGRIPSAEEATSAVTTFQAAVLLIVDAVAPYNGSVGSAELRGPAPAPRLRVAAGTRPLLSSDGLDRKAVEIAGLSALLPMILVFPTLIRRHVPGVPYDFGNFEIGRSDRTPHYVPSTDVAIDFDFSPAHPRGRVGRVFVPSHTVFRATDGSRSLFVHAGVNAEQFCRADIRITDGGPSASRSTLISTFTRFSRGWWYRDVGDASGPHDPFPDFAFRLATPAKLRIAKEDTLGDPWYVRDTPLVVANTISEAFFGDLATSEERRSEVRREARKRAREPSEVPLDLTPITLTPSDIADERERVRYCKVVRDAYAELGTREPPWWALE